MHELRPDFKLSSSFLDVSVEISNALRKLSDTILPLIETNFQANQIHLEKLKQTFLEFYNEETKETLDFIKKFKESNTFDIDVYYFDLTERVEQSILILKELESYPMKTFKKKVKIICKDSEVNPDEVITLVKRIRRVVINTTVKQAISNYNSITNAFFESEIKKNKLDYLLENQTLRILKPSHYSNFLRTVNLTFKAYYEDMKSFFKSSKFKMNKVWEFLEFMIQYANSFCHTSKNLKKSEHTNGRLCFFNS